jgi:hypothetical protein
MVSKSLNISSQFAGGECLRLGVSIGGETTSSGWDSNHRISDAIMRHVVDELGNLCKPLETPVKLCVVVAAIVSYASIVVGG